MFATIGRTARKIALLAPFGLVHWHADAVEPPRKPSPGELTHVLVAEAAYYATGPQQARPPDGTFRTGTKVELLRSAGSYSQVRASNGVVAYVASDALQEIAAADPVKITDELRSVARSNNQFAFDLYQHLRDEQGNLFFSPASISTALAMTYAGAEGQTEQQMAEVLHIDLPDERLHDGFAGLTRLLSTPSAGYELRIANRLWGQHGLPFRQEFLANTRQRYEAELAQVDFARTEETRQQINSWVEEETEGKIEDLIPRGLLSADTRLVLTNAIYFKGAWDDEFSERRTEDAPFHVSRQRETQVPLMHQTDDFRYSETSDLQVLELPYAEKDLSMIILLPKDIEGLADRGAGLTADAVQQSIEALAKRKVEVYLPKFTVRSQFRLARVLRAMGMTLAFSNRADFSGISTSEELMLSEVVHKAFVDVNEQGTEAAAATAVLAEPTAAPPTEREEPVVFRADHPFLFLIRDHRTGAVLFLGRVVDPAT